MTRTAAAPHCTLLGALFLRRAFESRIRNPIAVTSISTFGNRPPGTTKVTPPVFFALALCAARIVEAQVAIGLDRDGSLVVLVPLEEA